MDIFLAIIMDRELVGQSGLLQSVWYDEMSFIIKCPENNIIEIVMLTQNIQLPGLNKVAVLSRMVHNN